MVKNNSFYVGQKASPLLTLLILAICIIACADKGPVEDANNDNVKDTVVMHNADVIDTFETGKVIKQVICKTDANQSYALYIPSQGKNKILPVIYFLDPHGDGSLPLNKYKTLADKYGFILIGSNNSKNGNDWPTAESIWRTITGDSQKRLKINPDRVYVCGFSGGARVAGYVALNHSEVKAVIANGAGLNGESAAANFNFEITFIAGEGDMNMTEMVAFNNELDKTPTRHRIIFFDGKHEWAPQNAMNIAFAGLQLDAMYKKLLPKNDVLIKEYSDESKKQLVGLLTANELVKADRECKLSISMLNGLTNDVNWFKEKETSLIHNSAWQKQWQAQQNLFITEQNLMADYMQQFQREDLNYWKKTINDLQVKARAQTAEGALYQRLSAYLSLAFYSFSSRCITANQDAEAQYFVDLYKLADPTNSEAWYFSAIINARNNKARAAEDDLLKAVALGFSDRERIQQQPDFERLATQLHLPDIENKMKK